MTRLHLAARRTFRSLSVRNFRVFFIGLAVSQTGTWLQLIAQTLLVLRLRGSGLALGLLVVCQFLPVLVLGPWAGVLADRLDPRRTMFVTQAVMLSQAAVLGALTLAGSASLPLVYGLALVGGVANAVDTTIRRVLVTRVVDRDDLPNAVALQSMVMTASRVVGPALAGVMVTTVGIGWCFVANSVSFVAVIVALAMLRLPEREAAAPRSGAWAEIRAGLRYVGRDPELRVTMLLMAVVSTLAFNWQVVLPLFAARTLGGNETTYTVLTTIVSVGSLIGSLYIAGRRRLDLNTIVGAAAAFGAAMTALALAPSFLLAALTGLVAGATGIGYLSATSSFVQLRATDAMRSRVISLHTVLFLGSTPIGGPIAGWVTQSYGPRAGLLLGAVPTLAAAAWAWRDGSPARAAAAAARAA